MRPTKTREGRLRSRRGATAGRGTGEDRGATLLETAIILPILILLAFGIVDFGLLFRHYHSLAGAVRTGARVGANAGSDADADWQIVQAVLNARGTIPGGKITRIVVYKADADDGSVPTACKTASQSGSCNTYGPSYFGMTKAEFLASGGSSSWTPSSRQSSAFSETDHIGVWTLTDFDYVTGIFGDSRTVSDTTVMRIDPDAGEINSTVTTLPPPPPTTTAPPTTTTRPPSTTTTRAPTTTTRPRSTTTTRAGATTTTRPATTTTRPATTTTRPPTTTTTFRRGGG